MQPPLSAISPPPEMWVVRSWLKRLRSGFRTDRRQRPRALQDRFDCADVVASAFVDCLFDAGLGMLTQELEHADELASAGQRAVTLFQLCAKGEEGSRQVPIAIDWRVIQRRWFT